MLQLPLTLALLNISVLKGGIKTVTLKLSFAFPFILPKESKALDCQLWALWP